MNLNDINLNCGCALCSKGEHVASDNVVNDYISAAAVVGSQSAGEQLLATQWVTNNLQYKFLSSIPSYYSSGDEERSGFQAFTQSMQDATEEILGQIETFTNINFTETSSDSGYGTLTFAQSSLPVGTGAWAYYPTFNAKGGDVWVNNIYSSTQNMELGNYGYFTMMHEIGHALGLQHSFEVFSGQQATSQYSVMAYDWSPYFSTSYMVYDIAALQEAYGANMSYKTGDDTYVLSATYAYTIWDAGGIDTFDVSSKSIDTILDLREGAYSTVGLTNNIGIAYGAIIENAEGGSGDDTFIGNNANNILNGNAGDDIFYASGGDDIIDGGNGYDIIHYDLDYDQFILSTLDSLTFSLRNIFTDVLDTISNIERFFFNDVAYTVDGANGTEKLFDFNGTESDDTINGAVSDDIIRGYGGDDLLNGKEGNDSLFGGLGSDGYIFERGGGVDIILDDGGTLDYLAFGSSINSADTVFTQVGNNLEITINGSPNDKVVIENHFLVDSAIEKFIYKDDLVLENTYSLSPYSNSINSNGSANDSVVDAISNITGANGLTSEGRFTSSGTTYNSHPAWKAFDGSTSGKAWSSSAANPWAAFEFDEAAVINKYMIAARSDYHNYAITAPNSWTFESSNDGINWNTLDSVSNETGWGSGEVRYYDFSNDTSYEHYRVNFNSNNGHFYYSISEIDFIEAEEVNGHLLFPEVELAFIPGVDIQSVVLRLDDHEDGILNEVISADLSNGVTSDYSLDAATGDFLLQISGTASAEEYQDILRSVIYQNQALTPTDGNRNFSLEITNSFGDTSSYTTDVFIGENPNIIRLDASDHVSWPAGINYILEADGALNDSVIDAMPNVTGADGITSAGRFTSSGTTYNSHPAWKVMDGSIAGTAWSSSDSNPWAAFEFDDAIIVNKYMISARSDYHNHAITAPKSWTFESSNDGINWNVLDSVSDETGWGSGEARYYDFTNDTSYEHYRVNFSSNNGHSYYSISEIDFIEVKSEIDLASLPASIDYGVSANGALNSSVIDAIPNVTRANGITNEGRFTSSGTTYNSHPAWKVMDGSTSGKAWSSSADNPWAAFEFNDAKIINKYMIAARTDYHNHEITAPKSWTFESSNDGINWNILDTVSDETGWGSGEARYYDFTNDISYEHYRINFSSNNGHSYYSISEIDFIETVASLNPQKSDLIDGIILTPNGDDLLSGVDIEINHTGSMGSDHLFNYTLAGMIDFTKSTIGDVTTLKFYGEDSTAIYQQVLRSIEYQNTSDNINDDLIVRIKTYDLNANLDQEFIKDVDLYYNEIAGTAGNDTITGSSNNEILYGNDGLDVLIGGAGADIFAIKSDGAFNDIDQINDFNASEGDALDLSELLGSYDPLSDTINDFVQITSNGTDSFVAIDQDGTGSTHGFTQIAMLKDIVTDEDALQSSGSLITG